MIAGCWGRSDRPPAGGGAIALESLTWDGVDAALLAADDALRRQVATHAAPSDPVLYLRGMMITELGDPIGALAVFDQIDLAGIPARKLYIPYRLRAEMRPEQPNRYWAPLYQARASGELSALMRARVCAIAGEELEALEAYYDSDPADWKQLDVTLFRQLNLHSGLQSEVRQLLSAALAGKRVPTEVYGKLLEVLLVRPDDRAAAAQLARIRQELSGNPELAATVVQASIPLLAAQQLFMGRQYLEIVDRFGALDPVDQADRLVLLVLLSAAQSGNQPLLTRWSQELYRRYPTPEMKQWIDSIRNQVAASH
jgi:hypothetical protein